MPGSWPTWSGATTNATADTGTGSSSTAWIAWNGSGLWTSSATDSVTLTWRAWNSSATTSTNTDTSASWLGWNRVYQAVRETPEARAERARRTEERSVRYEQERLAREAAEEKANGLLQSHLSESQRRQLAEHDWFLIVSSTGKRYRIRRGRSGNVDLLDRAGKVVQRYCAHPQINCPHGDTMLAQKLALETDEASFLRLANKHGVPYREERIPELYLVGAAA